MSKQTFKSAILLASSFMLALFGSGITSALAADFNMSYLYFGDTKTYVKYVDRAHDSLKVISPSFFNLDSDGSLQLTEQVDSSFVEQMHQRGIEVVPFLSNHWDRELGRSALKNKELLASQIAEAIARYNLDGVNVDIENVTDIDRDDYTALVRLLREKIPPNKEVSVAVAANPNGWTTGWHGSYDYKELSKYADYLMLMAYDESYEGGPQGPVASIDWVEKSIQYTISQQVPKDKIVLGLPFYGRYWMEGQAHGGYGIANIRVEQLVEQFKGKVFFDRDSNSVRATFTVGPQDPAPVVGDRKLAPGNYTVWYENNETLKAKLELVNKYNLKGTGSWSLGQENPTLWLDFKNWLNASDQVFLDIEGSWAKNDILSVFNKGWMEGTAPKQFAPKQWLTRAQTAAVVVRFLGLAGNLNHSTFNDVPAYHWAKNDIGIAAQNGIMIGVDQRTFAPDVPVQREELAAILNRILLWYNPVHGAPHKVGALPFPDVKSTDWAYANIYAVYQKGIYQGFEDGTFRPKQKVEREQMAALMNRIAEFFS